MVEVRVGRYPQHPQLKPYCTSPPTAEQVKLQSFGKKTQYTLVENITFAVYLHVDRVQQ